MPHGLDRLTALFALPGAAVPGLFVRAAALAGELMEAARTLLPTQLPAAPLENQMTDTLTRRQRRRIAVRENAAPWSRAWRRAISRDEARKHAHYNGDEPRFEPARNDTCQAHHRQLPCKRCTEGTS